MPSVVIKGDSVAAYCCLHLLGSANVPVAIERRDRARVPAIMLSDAAAGLMRDVFGRPYLLRDAHRIHKRIVAWGKDTKPLEVPHSAVVVSEPFLLESLGQTLSFKEPEQTETGWDIFTSRPLPPLASEERFGNRSAFAVPVQLVDATDAHTCWIESLPVGWLFLIPNARDSAWLLSIGDTAEALLAKSHVIAPRIASSAETSREFPACPRIMFPLCGPDWLACGTAAMAFDPIGGDGAANAVREAILASAVIRAANEGGNVPGLLAHYESRLIAGFYRHLLLCHQFYKSGDTGPWWADEVKSLERGLEWCTRKAGGPPRFQYQLNGFELQAVS